MWFIIIVFYIKSLFSVFLFADVFIVFFKKKKIILRLCCIYCLHWLRMSCFLFISPRSLPIFSVRWSSKSTNSMSYISISSSLKTMLCPDTHVLSVKPEGEENVKWLRSIWGKTLWLCCCRSSKSAVLTRVFPGYLVTPLGNEIKGKRKCQMYNISTINK